MYFRIYVFEMEIMIAVVRMQEKKSDKINSIIFEVLLVNEPCSSSRHEIRMQLPRCHVPPNSDPAETALSFVQYHCRFCLSKKKKFFFWILTNLLISNICYPCVISVDLFISNYSLF